MKMSGAPHRFFLALVHDVKVDQCANKFHILALSQFCVEETPICSA